MILSSPLAEKQERILQKDTKTQVNQSLFTPSHQSNALSQRYRNFQPSKTPIFKIHSSKEIKELSSIKFKDRPKVNVTNARASLDYLTRFIYGPPTVNVFGYPLADIVPNRVKEKVKISEVDKENIGKVCLCLCSSERITGRKLTRPHQLVITCTKGHDD